MRPHRATTLLCCCIILSQVLFAQGRTIDYRYAPAHFHTPIGFADDWQKTMVNERGFLLYDFGPGPYVRGNTIVGIGIKGSELKQTSQRLENASIPIVMTELSDGSVKVRSEAFAIVPAEAHTAKSKTETSKVRRRLGLTGGIAWANPEGAADPAFRNVAWGTNRPILYRLKIEPGSRKNVALGFCESYRTTTGQRMMECHVEGAEVRTVDPIAESGRNKPVVFFFAGGDANRDGLLEIEVRPSALVGDPNVILNAVWVFPGNATFTAEQVIRGDATKQAEIYIDCGREPEVKARPTRIDALLVTTDNSSATPIITIQSARILQYDAKSGVLEYGGRPFVASRPKPTSARKTEQGWELDLPRGTGKAEIIVISGYRLPKSITEVPDLKKEREKSVQWWSKDPRVPKGRVTLPDAQMQHLFDASVRTLYQNRDQVDGYPQFQPGSTVYRGLWIHDGVYYAEAAAILGDTLSARLATEELFEFQDPTGKVRVMWPIEMRRETPMILWMMDRYARLANNPDWLRAHWGRAIAAMDYTRRMREETMLDTSLSYYGLIPPGFMDGGIAGLTAEYCSVYWTLVGVHSAVGMAQWLGKSKEQREWQGLYDEMLASFRRAARRDVRRDQSGNEYLPLRVADTTTTDVAARAQWAICEAIHLAPIFPPDDALVEGSFAVIDSSCVQGLPTSFGWMTGGIGVWFAPLYGLARFVRGDVDRAVDVLYAFANHATPHGAWAEEQMPKGVSTRTTGDYPTTSATACMLRSVMFFLAFERGTVVEVLRGVPKEWFAPGSVVRTKDLRTKFGTISVEASVSKDGSTGRISLDSKGHGDADDSMAQYTDAQGGLELYLVSLKELGYKSGIGTEFPDHVRVRWGQKVELEFHR